ncbi:hypothetical protein NE237_016195 [Protea cynaroides]|uniref:Uncharacterized protein n=1 Tax=Protea cynaroides TaxID=273540 RepID=A0A9Q0QRX8_9MAGN|nr:hypothetical protein NE237_016195 [Protea cynaroides]
MEEEDPFAEIIRECQCLSSQEEHLHQNRSMRTHLHKSRMHAKFRFLKNNSFTTNCLRQRIALSFFSGVESCQGDASINIERSSFLETLNVSGSGAAGRSPLEGFRTLQETLLMRLQEQTLHLSKKVVSKQKFEETIGLQSGIVAPVGDSKEASTVEKRKQFQKGVSNTVGNLLDEVVGIDCASLPKSDFKVKIEETVCLQSGIVAPVGHLKEALAAKKKKQYQEYHVGAVNAAQGVPISPLKAMDHDPERLVSDGSSSKNQSLESLMDTVIMFSGENNAISDHNKNSDMLEICEQQGVKFPRP